MESLTIHPKWDQSQHLRGNSNDYYKNIVMITIKTIKIKVVKISVMMFIQELRNNGNSMV